MDGRKIFVINNLRSPRQALNLRLMPPTVFGLLNYYIQLFYFCQVKIFNFFLKRRRCNNEAVFLYMYFPALPYSLRPTDSFLVKPSENVFGIDCFVAVALYGKGKAVLRKAYFKIGRAKPQPLRNIRAGCFFTAIANFFYVTVVGCFDV